MTEKSSHLLVYLKLELDAYEFECERHDEAADVVRDFMDPLWYRLDEMERAALNSRIGEVDVFVGTVPQESSDEPDSVADADRIIRARRCLWSVGTP